MKTIQLRASARYPKREKLANSDEVAVIDMARLYAELLQLRMRVRALEGLAESRRRPNSGRDLALD